MPTYSYRCTQCDHRFDAFQKFTDNALTECPECGSPLRKIFHAAGVVFKGSGWYINDSRGTSTSATPAAKTDAAPAGDGKKADSAAATSSTSESKSETQAKSVAAD